MVSHYDCKKQYNLRQFNLLKVKQCTEDPSNIQYASVKARVYVRAKAKRIKAYKFVAYTEKEKRFVSKAQLNIDVWIELYGTITLCHFLLHLILQNVKILLDISTVQTIKPKRITLQKTFTLLEDHYFQDWLEQYRTPFTVHQLKKMYTGTFSFLLPADKDWIYDPTRKPYYNCPANHQF